MWQHMCVGLCEREMRQKWSVDAGDGVPNLSELDGYFVRRFTTAYKNPPGYPLPSSVNLTTLAMYT